MPAKDPAEILFAPRQRFLDSTLDHLAPGAPPRAIVLADGTRVEHLALGVLKIEPSCAATRQLVISAGIHGNETAPIEICDRLVAELLNADWTAGTRALIILGNPAAMAAGTRFTEFNLNRLFAGTYRKPGFDGFYESARAALIEQQVRDFTRLELPLWHYDLHTAIRDSRREKFALYPFLPDRKLPAEQKRFLLDSGVGTVLYQHKRAATFASWTSSEFAAESFTVELGKARPFGENDLGQFRDIYSSLRQLLTGKDLEIGANDALAIDEFKVVHEIVNTGAEFKFHIADDVANFTEYPPGTLIWEDSENQYRVGPATESIVFPNREVPVGQRVGLMVTRL